MKLKAIEIKEKKSVVVTEARTNLAPKSAKEIKTIIVLTIKSIVVVVAKKQAGENRKKDDKFHFCLT
jgi:hypothetical protein